MNDEQRERFLAQLGEKQLEVDPFEEPVCDGGPSYLTLMNAKTPPDHCDRCRAMYQKLISSAPMGAGGRLY